jgi:hypothetical protein
MVGGGGRTTVDVWFDVDEADPSLLVAVTTDSRRSPRSAAVGEYALAVAPEIGLQDVAEVHLCHWMLVVVTSLVGVYVPVLVDTVPVT